MGVSLASSGGYDAIHRIVYTEKMNEQLRQEFLLLNRIQECESHELYGDEVRLDVHVARSGGIQLYAGATQLDAAVDIPVGGSSKFEYMTFPLMYMLMSIGVDHQAHKRARKDAINRAAHPWEREEKDLMVQVRATLQKLYYGDQSGAMADVTAFSNGGGTGGLELVTVRTTRNLQEGSVYDFYRSGSLVTDAADMTVVNIISETQFEGSNISGTPASGDIMVLADSYGKAPSGLEHIIDNDNTSQGVNRAVNYWAAATVYSNNSSAGTAIEYNKRRMAAANITVENRYGKIQRYLASVDVTKAVAWVEYGMRRIDARDMGRQRIETFDSGVDINGKPLLQDVDCTRQTIYGVNFDELVRGQIGEFIEMYTDPNGGNHIRPSLSTTTARYKTAWEATWEHWGNVGWRTALDQLRFPDVLGLSEGDYPDYGGAPS